ncbi:MAG TPA: quinoprotein dehydrogenase-associated putative ABC transporter substrate-binding protein [Terriglobales bacterium]|jgi:quinoprotein dehydrogenase-associated probable ABC transporter substrate-binding protein|nr:quinoprotein dehydrogenase-associated putative ABC transporter substrate-binding protein [Terriglobales bacterium]
MYSVYRFLVLPALLLVVCTVTSAQVLRVCADSNNLPYSNDRGEGFENKLAELVAHDLGRQLEYVWWPASPLQSRKLFRSGACDVMIEAPTHYELAETTRPYYRSSYVFVTRKDRHLSLHSLHDPFLRVARIGLHGVGDGEFTPPAQELASQGIVRNVSVYTIFGNLSRKNPPAELIDAVARGDIDVAIAWGPLGGYFGKQSAIPLEVSIICPEKDDPTRPLTFDMAMAVKRGNENLRQELESELTRRQSQIREVLESYSVPMLEPGSKPRSCP